MNNDPISSNKRITIQSVAIVVLAIINLPFSLALEVLKQCGLFITKHNYNETFTLNLTSKDRLILHIIGIPLSLSFYYIIFSLGKII